MNRLKRIWNDPVWSNVISAAIVGLVATTYATLKLPVTPFGIAAASVIGILIVAIICFWPKRVKWQYGMFLGMSGHTDENGRRIIDVNQFQASGFNRGNKAIASMSSFIQSDITNERREVFFVIDGKLVSANKLQGIPPKTSFQIAAPLMDPNISPLGMSADKFLQDYGSFTFEIIVDGDIYRKHFRRKIVKRMVDQFKNVGVDRDKKVYLKNES